MSKSGVGSIVVFIAIIFFIITFPTLEISPKFDNPKNNSLQIDYSGIAKVTVGVWNKGGNIAGVNLITPQSCLSLIGLEDYNISCVHDSYKGDLPCSSQVCDESPVGKISANQEMRMFFSKDNLPSQFQFVIKLNPSVGPINLPEKNASFTCLLSDSKYLYFCKN